MTPRLRKTAADLLDSCSLAIAEGDSPEQNVGGYLLESRPRATAPETDPELLLESHPRATAPETDPELGIHVVVIQRIQREAPQSRQR
jgi:hypothetical protein